jgi:hypothetical protein
MMSALLKFPAGTNSSMVMGSYSPYERELEERKDDDLEERKDSELEERERCL